MPRAGFEPTIPVFERSKALRALDCAATGIGTNNNVYFLLQRMVINDCSLRAVNLTTQWDSGLIYTPEG